MNVAFEGTIVVVNVACRAGLSSLGHVRGIEGGAPWQKAAPAAAVQLALVSVVFSSAKHRRHADIEAALDDPQSCCMDLGVAPEHARSS